MVPRIRQKLHVEYAERYPCKGAVDEDIEDRRLDIREIITWEGREGGGRPKICWPGVGPLGTPQGEPRTTLKNSCMSRNCLLVC